MVVLGGGGPSLPSRACLLAPPSRRRSGRSDLGRGRLRRRVQLQKTSNRRGDPRGSAASGERLSLLCVPGGRGAMTQHFLRAYLVAAVADPVRSAIATPSAFCFRRCLLGFACLFGRISRSRHCSTGASACYDSVAYSRSFRRAVPSIEARGVFSALEQMSRAPSRLHTHGDLERGSRVE